MSKGSGGFSYYVIASNTRTTQQMCLKLLCAIIAQAEAYIEVDGESFCLWPMRCLFLSCYNACRGPISFVCSTSTICHGNLLVADQPVGRQCQHEPLVTRLSMRQLL